ncbi:MFS transporter [Kitasatospora sp. NPDC058397]|uniref:MFS transporter n=1 Tax=unclassified Kitasatospora TaxID=2633591 RepID=UPI00366A2806
MTTASPTSVDSAPIPSEPDPGGGVLSGRYRALTLGIVSVVLVIAFEATAVNTAMPTAARQLNGIGLYAFAFSGYFTTTLFALVVSGQWCDRRGPLQPLFTGIAVFGVGLVVAGTAPGMWVFVAGRAVQGLGGGLVIVALYVVVGRAYPERLRPAVFAAFSSAWVLPSIIGPLVSGAITQHLGWRWVFLAVPVLILLPLAVMGPALTRSEREHPVARGAEFDRRRTLLAAMAALGAGLLQYAGGRHDLIGLLPGTVGAALLVPAVLGLLPERTLRAGRGLPAVILLRGLAAGAFLGAEAFVPLMMTTERGLSPTMSGLTLTSGGLTWALGSWLQGRPGAERYREAMIRGGFVLTAVAIAGAALVLVPAVPAWVAAVAWGIGGIGMGLTVASVSVLMMKLSAPEDAGVNSAALQMSDALGNVLLTGLAGVMFAVLGGGSLAAAHEGAGAAGSSGAAGSPLAFAVILLAMAGVALLGALLSGRVRTRS